MSSFVELGLQDRCADRESLYMSLFVLCHTPGHGVISKIKDDKIIYILQRYAYTQYHCLSQCLVPRVTHN